MRTAYPSPWWRRAALTAALAIALLHLPGVNAASATPAANSGIAFSPCTLSAPGLPQLVAARCGRLDVPENSDLPRGRRLSLSVALVPARSPQAASDPVVFLAGGPGQSAQHAYLQPNIQAALEPLRAERDIVLLDQRGTGDSHPLPCIAPDFETVEREPGPAELRAAAEACLQRLRADADLRYYTTVDAAQDLESLRQALGAPRFNLIGGSYGTRLGFEYLRRFPQGVRTLVADGVVPPALALGQEHAANLEDALQRIFAACVEDTACGDRFGNPAVSLTRLRAALRAQPQKVSLRDPFSAEPVTQTLNETYLAAVMRFYAYAPEFASLLPLIIDEAVNGRPEALVAQGLIVTRGLEDELMHGMELSVTCNEDADLLRERPEDASTLLGNALPRLLRAQCAVWPRRDPAVQVHSALRSNAPVLLLSGELDPVTPSRYAQSMLADLPNARHLVVRGRGHIVMGNGCMPQLLRRFVQRQSAEQLDAACLDVLRAPPFFTSYSGPEP